MTHEYAVDIKFWADTVVWLLNLFLRKTVNQLSRSRIAFSVMSFIFLHPDLKPQKLLVGQ